MHFNIDNIHNFLGLMITFIKEKRELKMKRVIKESLRKCFLNTQKVYIDWN